MDIRAHGKDFDRFVNRAKDEYGIRYIRSMPSVIKELQQTNNLLIKYVNQDGTLTEEEFDMVGAVRRSYASQEKPKNWLRAWGLNLKNMASVKPLWKIRCKLHVPVFLSAVPSAGRKIFQKQLWKPALPLPVRKGLLAARRGYDDYPRRKSGRKRFAWSICSYRCFLSAIAASILVVWSMFPLSVIMRQLCLAVVFTADNLFTCSQDTAVKMAEVIKEQNLTRVVVASCSPRTHEGVFQENCEKAGLNRYLFEMGQYPPIRIPGCI